MSWTQETHTDGETVYGSDLNKYEEAITELYSNARGYYFNAESTLSGFVSTIIGIGTNGSYVCTCSGGSLNSSLTNGNTTSSLKGIVTRVSATMIDFMLCCAGGNCIYTGRIESGTVTSAYKFTGTSIL